jgi:23S rRNA pseudouridine1911/1915/1917 synthase
LKFNARAPGSLFDILVATLDGKSRTGIKKLLSQRMVSVDGVITTKFDAPVKISQLIEIGKRPDAEIIPLRGISIRYDDEYLVIIDKASGLLSVPADVGTTRSAYSTLDEYLQNKDSRSKLYIVHRLDRETSGVMMFVKDPTLQREFRENWQQLVTRRTYSVVVEGAVSKPSGTLVSWLEGTDGLRTYASNSKAGQKAVLKYTVVQQNTAFSLLDIELETGRKNQIRVQMQEMGHPVVGDVKYGASGDPIGRLALHARLLQVIHPGSKEEIKVESAIPPGFMKLVET